MLFVCGVILIVGGLWMEKLCGTRPEEPDNMWNKRAASLVIWGAVFATISVCIYAAKNMP